MSELFYIVTSFVGILIDILMYAMFIRALLSWLPLAEDNPIENFLFAITEPVILPVRAVLDRFEILSELPIDISFLVTMILLSIVSGIV